MAKKKGSLTNFSGGIADSSKEGLPNSYAFGRSIDYRSDAKKITILPKALKESGNVVEDLVMAGEIVGSSSYFYGNEGNLYLRNSSYVWSKEHKAPNSSGNGLAYFGEDKYLYYTQDKTIGRYGQIGSDNPGWYDAFLESEGGDPTNTHSLDLEAGSEQYAKRADTASLSFTGDCTFEVPIKPESLPTGTNTMTLLSKWDESGTTKSYKVDIIPTSGAFGDGSDGALTISADTTEAPVDSSCSGTVDTKTLTATNTSFATAQKILIHQTRGTNAGVYQVTEIESYTAGTITTVDPLEISYNSTGDNKAQVRVMKQYTTVTVNASKIYTVKAWNGTVGGIMAFFANDTVAINGKIDASGEDVGVDNKGYNYLVGGAKGGFRGGNGYQSGNAYCGEGTGGPSARSDSSTSPHYYPDGNNWENWPNGNGGGGSPSTGAGAGGGNATTGFTVWPDNKWSYGGLTSGSTDLSIMTFGGGGGAAGGPDSTWGAAGGSGGGIIYLQGKTITMGDSGVITASGGGGADRNNDHGAGGGGGSGSILLRADVADLGTVAGTWSVPTAGVMASSYYGEALGSGNHGDAVDGWRDAGDGGEGRIHLDYYTSYSGTTFPALDVIQDESLVGGDDGYLLRLHISDDGDNSETYSWNITEEIEVDGWARWQIAWDASASTAYFYKNGNLLGQKTGSMTAIDDNASEFAIGADTNDEGDYDNFFDGLVDDVRVWNDIRTATELKRYNDFILYGTEPGLIDYYKFDNDVTDSQTSGLNDLTAVNTPTYSTDVFFSGVTTRADLDQSLDTSGNTYTLATTISEAATALQAFTPAKDPQKSVEVNIASTGTGNWTVTVHDSLNREIAAVTVALAQLHTGDYEFEFASVWRPVIGDEYHFHVTSTVADGTVVTTDSNDLETADYHTYFQVLVSDKYHPAVQFLNFLAIGNERYVSKLEGGNVYTPHAITLPSGYRVRCLGFWREFLAIGTWKGSNIYDYDAGRIFFWDGTESTYNFFIDVPEGGINCLFGTKGLLYILAGYSGDLLLYQGGDAAQKIKRIPKMTNNKYVEIFPNAIDMWKTLLRIGVAGNSDSSVIEKGIYSWGSINRNYLETLSYDYPLSIGIRTDTNVKIGMVKAIGQKMLISWKNVNTQGVDAVSVGNNPSSTATYEALITDLDSISQKKYPLILRADFEALRDGESIKVKYKPDRWHTWFDGEIVSTIGRDASRLILKEKCKEIQVAVDLGCSGSTSPVLTGITLESEMAEKGRNA